MRLTVASILYGIIKDQTLLPEYLEDHCFLTLVQTLASSRGRHAGPPGDHHHRCFLGSKYKLPLPGCYCCKAFIASLQCFGLFHLCKRMLECIHLH